MTAPTTRVRLNLFAGADKVYLRPGLPTVSTSQEDFNQHRRQSLGVSPNSLDILVLQIVSFVAKELTRPRDARRPRRAGQLGRSLTQKRLLHRATSASWLTALRAHQGGGHEFARSSRSSKYSLGEETSCRAKTRDPRM